MNTAEWTVFHRPMSLLMDNAMTLERAEVLEAEPYERTETRRGYANGFKPKTLHTRLGEVPLRVPQVRGDVSFYPSALTKGSQTERALTLGCRGDVPSQGVSTRKVKPIPRKTHRPRHQQFQRLQGPRPSWTKHCRHGAIAP